MQLFLAHWCIVVFISQLLRGTAMPSHRIITHTFEEHHAKKHSDTGPLKSLPIGNPGCNYGHHSGAARNSGTRW